MSNPLSLPAVAVASKVEGFNYSAQTNDGYRITGTIEAPYAEQAMVRLKAMDLRVIELMPATPPAAGSAIRGTDFAAFNQQLAQLTGAGLPIEQGLRLIGNDMRRGRMKATIEQLAGELESGTPLDQAIDKFGGKFPPLYGRLIGAGIKSGNLSAVLLNLGRHLEMVQRLRNVLWRTLAYPFFVLIAVGLLLSFLGIAVIPQFAKIYASDSLSKVNFYGFSGVSVVSTALPWPTRVLLAVSQAAPVLLILTLLIAVGIPMTSSILRATGRSGPSVERWLIRMPLIGPVLRFNLVARWCDAARLGVAAGLDLPTAIELAGDATRSPHLSSDGAALKAALAAGRPLTVAQTRYLPTSVPAAIQFASGHNDLETTLASLSEMYQRQADLRLTALPGILTPIFVIFLALIIGFIILGLLAPLITIIESFTR